MTIWSGVWRSQPPPLPNGMAWWGRGGGWAGVCGEPGFTDYANPMQSHKPYNVGRVFVLLTLMLTCNYTQYFKPYTQP